MGAGVFVLQIQVEFELGNGLAERLAVQRIAIGQRKSGTGTISRVLSSPDQSMPSAAERPDASFLPKQRATISQLKSRLKALARALSTLPETHTGSRELGWALGQSALISGARSTLAATCT